MKKREQGFAKRNYVDDSVEDRQFLVAIARGFNILQIIGEDHLSSFSNAELSEITGLSKATVSRITYTLATLGLINYIEDTGQYKIGVGGISLGYSSLKGCVIEFLAKPLMQELADDCGLAVAVGKRVDLNIVYTGSEQSNDLFSLKLEIGSQIPIESTAIGHAYLAGLPDIARAKIINQIKFNLGSKFTSYANSIDLNLELYKTQGYTLTCGLWHPHVNAVGIPFKPEDGSPLMAFTCGGLSHYANYDRLKYDIAPKLVAMVSKIDNMLKHASLD